MEKRAVSAMGSGSADTIFFPMEGVLHGAPWGSGVLGVARPDSDEVLTVC